jgi:hypothetical protein
MIERGWTLLGVVNRSLKPGALADLITAEVGFVLLCIDRMLWYTIFLIKVLIEFQLFPLTEKGCSFAVRGCKII